MRTIVLACTCLWIGLLVGCQTSAPGPSVANDTNATSAGTVAVDKMRRRWS